MENTYQALTISHIRQEQPDFKTFYFADDPAHPLLYQAGQYLTLVLKHQQQEIRRSYSFISAPVLQEAMAIGVKRVDNGFFSRHLIDRVQPGDQILSAGVGGLFTLPGPPGNYRQVFFFAAGSGITPIFSLLKSLLYGYPSAKAVLVYSNRRPEQAIYLTELRQLAAAFPNRFHLECLFSEAANLSRARLHRDLLEELVAQYALVPAGELLAYVCGPLNYMRMCTYGLREIGVPADNIRKENFSTEKPRTLLLPPDQDLHQVSFHWQGRAWQVPVQYPATILQAARRQGLQLPYSCEAGRCGNCVARCLSGQVWLAYNEVLTHKELARGLTLTCMGYPVGGDVVLEIESPQRAY
ncbi:MAG: 2Fe-2S iron-sulfur cluster-binding protein [Adhaeribacter sp.]